MFLIRYQHGFTALHSAAKGGQTEVTSLLLDREADVKLQDKVSDMTREIVISLFIIEGVIKTVGDSSVIVRSSSQRRCKFRCKCDLDNSQVAIIACTN